MKIMDYEFSEWFDTRDNYSHKIIYFGEKAVGWLSLNNTEKVCKVNLTLNSGYQKEIDGLELIFTRIKSLFINTKDTNVAQNNIDEILLKINKMRAFI